MQNQDLYLTLRIFYKPLFYKSLRLLGYFSDNILFILFLNTVSKPNIFIKILFTAPYQNHSHVFLFFYVNLSPWSWLPLFFTWISLITSNTYTLIAYYQFSIPQKNKIQNMSLLCFWPFNNFHCSWNENKKHCIFFLFCN